MRGRFIAVGLAVATLGGCAAFDMGTADSNLVQLLREQERCRATMAQPASAPSRDDLLACETAAQGLENLAADFVAKATEPGIDTRNAVFFYRRAATAAWQTYKPAVMDDALIYARSGKELCDTDGESGRIQPGDCVTLGLIGSLIAHDKAVRELENLRAELATATSAPGMTTNQTKDAEQAVLLSASGDAAIEGPGHTRIGAIARALFVDGWRGLALRRESVCSPRVHATVRAYWKREYDEMTTNLAGVYEMVNNSFAPHVSAGYKDGDYAAACAETAASDAAVGSVVAAPEFPGRAGIAHHVNRAAWCQWQYAKRHVPAACG